MKCILNHLFGIVRSQNYIAPAFVLPHVSGTIVYLSGLEVRFPPRLGLFYSNPCLALSSCVRQSYYFMFYSSLEPIVYIQFVMRNFYIVKKSVNIKSVSPALHLGQNPRKNTTCLCPQSIHVPYNYTLLQFYLTYSCSCWKLFERVQSMCIILHDLAKCD